MTKLTQQAREDIQGIILSGYGHLRYTSYLFFQIQDPSKAKIWLQSLIPEVTTGKPWQKRPDGTKIKPETTLNLAFTHPGLQVLNLPQHTLDTFSREFIEGMATSKRSSLLGDTRESAPEHWEIGGPNHPGIHLLLILNGINREKCQELRQQLLAGDDLGVILIHEEDGFRPESNKEHFGFHDGISQPKIEGIKTYSDSDPQVVKTGEFILGYTNEYNYFPSTPSLSADADPDNRLPSFPGPELANFKDFGRHGTYLVFRKLAQDVAGFWKVIAQEGQDLQGCPHASTMTLIASKFVGRWPSGTPLTVAPKQDNPQIEDKNDFKYLPKDREGYGCPIGAHIRRSNPRDAFFDATPEESLQLSNRHRLLRRGTLYGEPLFPLEDLDQGIVPLNLEDDGKPRGIHFVSINANIRRQFEFTQETWCNNPHFNGLYENKDPIIGDNNGSGKMTIQRQPIRQQVNNLPRFVTVKGGDYFFIPSLSALNFLANF